MTWKSCRNTILESYQSKAKSKRITKRGGETTQSRNLTEIKICVPGKGNHVQKRVVESVANRFLRNNFKTCEPNLTTNILFKR